MAVYKSDIKVLRKLIKEAQREIASRKNAIVSYKKMIKRIQFILKTEKTLQKKKA